MVNPQDKRRYPRRPFESKIGVLRRGIYNLIQTEEIGERGIGFFFPTELKLGDELVVSFFISTEQFIVCRAAVRFCLKKTELYRIGVELTNIKFEDRRKIRDYIAERGELFSVH